MKTASLTLACLLLCLTCPHFVAAGSLNGMSVVPGMSWKSSCSKPAKPKGLYGDSATYAQADAAYRQYIAAIKEYQRCLKVEAKTDLANIERAIKNIYNAEITNTKYEAQAAKQQLGVVKSRSYGAK